MATEPDSEPEQSSEESLPGLEKNEEYVQSLRNASKLTTFLNIGALLFFAAMVLTSSWTIGRLESKRDRVQSEYDSLVVQSKTVESRVTAAVERAEKAEARQNTAEREALQAEDKLKFTLKTLADTANELAMKQKELKQITLNRNELFQLADQHDKTLSAIGKHVNELAPKTLEQTSEIKAIKEKIGAASSLWFVYITSDDDKNAEEWTRGEAKKIAVDLTEKGVREPVRLYQKNRNWCIGIGDPVPADKARELVNQLYKTGYKEASRNPMAGWTMFPLLQQ